MTLCGSLLRNDGFLGYSRSVDLWSLPSQVDSPSAAWSDALGGHTTVATLAHELCWTCDCREDPRPCAADCWRLCPFIHWLLRLDPIKSACVLLPVILEVAFVTSCVCRACPTALHVNLKAFAALPRVGSRLGCYHQGHLVDALGLGCGIRKRPMVLWRPVPRKDCPIGKNDSWSS